jgi:hypothetical protein
LPTLGKEADETPLDSIVVDMDQPEHIKLERAIVVTNLETAAPLTERNIEERVHPEVYFIVEERPEPDQEIDHEPVASSSQVKVEALQPVREDIESHASNASKFGHEKVVRPEEQYGVEAYRWVVLAMHSGLCFNANIASGSYILMPKLIAESF